MKIQVSGPMPNARVAPIPPLHLVRSASAKVDFYSGGQEGGAGQSCLLTESASTVVRVSDGSFHSLSFI